MIVVRIEHPVGDFDAWKAAFDTDPVGRREGGVRRHRILRPIDDPSRVAIELEFDDRPTAAAFRERLVALWAAPATSGLGIGRPEVRVAEVAESVAY